MTRSCPSDRGLLASDPARSRHRAWSVAGLVVVFVASILLMACSSVGSEAKGPVRVEIISLDHSPIRPAAEKVSDLASEYGENVLLSAYHFDTPEGDIFADANGISAHTPIAVFVNGESEFDIEGSAVQLFSFPKGEGTGLVADGNWTIDDLRLVLDRAVSDLQAG